VELTSEEHVWLDGRAGEAIRVAMALVVRIGELFRAERLGGEVVRRVPRESGGWGFWVASGPSTTTPRASRCAS